MPAVSIIMPAYNDERYIVEAIASVKAQSYIDWELVIVNDGSKDGTLSVIQGQAAQDDRIVIVTHDYNEGLVSSLNDGLVKAQAPLVARLDSDDYWTDTQKLQKQVNFLQENPEHALVGTCGEAVSETGDFLFDMVFPTSDAEIRNELLRHNCFIHSSVMFRKDIVSALGGYEGKAGYVEDYELWLKLGLKHKFAVLPDKAVHYRINSQGLTQTRTVPQWQAFIDLMKQYKNDYPNFWPAYIKLEVQKYYIRIFGPKLFNKVKTVLLSFRNKPGSSKPTEQPHK